MNEPTNKAEVDRPTRRERRRRRKHCFHHARPAWAKGEVDSRSYIREQLIDTGKRKMYECRWDEGGCGRLWFG